MREQGRIENEKRSKERSRGQVSEYNEKEGRGREEGGKKEAGEEENEGKEKDEENCKKGKQRTRTSILDGMIYATAINFRITR